jgi:hypothetical protein
MLKKARLEIEDKDREIVNLTREVVELRLYKASLNSPDEKTDSSEAATIREVQPFTPDSPSREQLLLEDTFARSGTRSGATSGTRSEAASTATSPRTPEKKESSLVDSGHFEDGSVHSKESAATFLLANAAAAAAAASDLANLSNLVNESYDSTASGSLAMVHDESVNLLSVSPLHDVDTKRLVDHYERRIEEMHRRHVDEIQLLKQNQNDKVMAI